MRRLAMSLLLLVGAVSVQAEGPEFIDRVRNYVQENSEVAELLEQLDDEGYVGQMGDDGLRLKYVTLQGCVEQALMELDIPAVGFIHTPMPATPLCTLPDPIDTTLLDPSMRDQAVVTVQSRAQIVRDYLNYGGSLYIVYPQGGLERRSKEQQLTYLGELDNYPELLFDWPLSVPSMDPTMIGATYLFWGTDYSLWAFSIQSRQANDPQEMGQWAVWLGPIDRPQIEQRLQSLATYFDQVDGPPLQMLMETGPMLLPSAEEFVEPENS